ncbi:PIN domain-containing protein [Dehalococcoidia bacterium]|nr:PIN domain-containing protein [Dehalococcoidia bacterium]
MSGFLDTSAIVRYLTGDPPELAEQAAQIIDKLDDLLVTDVVLTETAYVLTSVYQVPREVTVDHLIAFLQRTNISPFALDKSLVLHALLLCRPSGRVSFADAMVWAAARSASNKVIYSFDKRFPRDGLEVRQTI